MKTEELYIELIDRIANLGKIELKDKEYIDKMTRVIEKIVESFCRENGVKINVVMDDSNQISFAYAQERDLHYCPTYIADLKKKLIDMTTTAKKGQYNPQYDDTSFGVYLLSALRHEVQHCLQWIQNENLDFSEQIYLNAVSGGIRDYRRKARPYLEMPFECEAYKEGINFAYNLPTYINKKFIEQINSSEMNFSRKNYIMANLSAWMNAIPYIKDDKGRYMSIVEYFNNIFSTKANSQCRKILLERYPTIGIGVSLNGEIKNPFELMEQYFNNRFELKESRPYPMNDQDLKNVEQTYVYLLMPYLKDRNVYEQLCNRFGRDKMNKFLLRMGENIQKKQERITEANKWIMFDMEKLEGCDTNVDFTVDEVREKIDYAKRFLAMSGRLVQEYTGTREGKGNISISEMANNAFQSGVRYSTVMQADNANSKQSKDNERGTY